MKPPGLLVFTSLPDLASADRIAALLVESRLAACVSRAAPVRSTYRWEGRVQVADEHPLVIKTSSECYVAVEEAIRLHHPHQVPEIVAIEIRQGLPAYLRWLHQESGTDGTQYA